MNFIKQHIPFFILIFSALLFVPFLGMVHLFDWDEINFAECAREMISSKDYLSLQMNYQPFWEKPPLFIWMSALSMKLFGVNEFAARFPNALCGMLTLLMIYKIGEFIVDKKMGLIWVLCYLSSTLPQFYFKSGIIDPWFNLFIFASVYSFILFSSPSHHKGKTVLLILSAVLLGLAVLTKGPVAAIIVALCFGIYLGVQKFKNVINLAQSILYLIIFLIVGGLWFVLLVLHGKIGIIEHFISYQAHLFHTEDAGHGGPFYYHFLVLLFGCFPASIFALRSFSINKEQTGLQIHFKKWMLILFWVVLILFSLVQTKIIHYSSLCYFPLTYFGAQSIYALLYGEMKWKKWMNYLLLLCGGTFAILLSLMPLIDRYKNQVIASGIIDDEFAVENLKATVNWQGWEFLIGVFGLVGFIYAILVLNRKQYLKAVLVLFLSNLFLVHLATLVIVPKIEQYTQGAAIEFYESMQSNDRYVSALKYHSYAQYFYTKKSISKNPDAYSTDWMLRGKIDKNAYFISKINEAQSIRETYPELIETGRKNGYIFYLRKPFEQP